MALTNKERLERYKLKMKEYGFQRISFYGSRELYEFLSKNRQPGECYGRMLERLLLGEAAKRPDYWERQEKNLRAARKRAGRMAL